MTVEPLTPINNPAVVRVFDGYPTSLRMGLFQLRELIFKLARLTDGVGRLEETLKWGQPSYVTADTKSGSTIRLGITKDQRFFGLYVHCQTTILSDFRDRFGDTFSYDGQRGILFEPGEDIHADQLEHCIIHGLTYHLKKVAR